MTQDEAIRELAHEPVPGYRRAFCIVFGASLGYLAFIFFMS